MSTRENIVEVRKSINVAPYRQVTTHRGSWFKDEEIAHKAIKLARLQLQQAKRERLRLTCHS